MGKHFLVFQHTAWEDPGHFLLDAAHKLQTRLTIVRLWEQKIPALSGFDGLIVLGGQPNIDQEEQYPFLKQEKIAIRQSLAENRPYLGICLGHQLLAEAIGALVGDNYCASIGLIDGFITKKGKSHPFFKKIPAKIPLFKWHSQAILEPIPRNITILATSADCLVEAFSLKSQPHIIGTQFDNNAASTAEVKKYFSKDEKWVSSLKEKSIDAAAVIADAQQSQETLARHYRRLFTNFVALT